MHRLMLRLSISLVSLVFFHVSGQVKIGENPDSIDASSLLELESSSKALVLTRVTTEQMLSLRPLRGALVYNTDDNCLFYFNGTWNNLCTGDSSIAFTNNDDGTFTLTDATGANLTIDEGPDAVTSLTTNDNQTYTFTNELGESTTFNVEGGNGSVNGTTGSLFFAGANGGVTENNPELFWDNTNNRLGIGLNTALTDKLNVLGAIGVDFGSESSPSYKFTGVPGTGLFYDPLQAELGLSINGSSKAMLSQTGLRVNNAISSLFPLAIRGNSGQQWIDLQDASTGVTLFNISYRGPGLRIDDLNVPYRLFIDLIPNADGTRGIGINTGDPRAHLDVDGTLRIRSLPPAEVGDTYVTVDSDGFFHSTATPVGTGSLKTPTNTAVSARWTNIETGLKSTGNSINLPIFAVESFKDGGDGYYKATKDALTIIKGGRYTIKSNLSILVSGKSVTGPIFTRILKNGVPTGPISVFQIPYQSGAQMMSSTMLNDTIEVDPGDIITLGVFKPKTLSWSQLKLTAPGSNVVVIDRNL